MIFENMERFTFLFWGLSHYQGALHEMMGIVTRRINNKGTDSIILLEHPPVITLGRLTKSEDLLGTITDSRISGIPYVKTDRGGGPTLHSPGQLVIYPVIRLKKSEQNLRRLLFAYEESLIRTSGDFGVHAGRIEGKTGVWAGKDKLASIGIHLKKWVTYHGLALNVSNDLSLFQAIIPCGLTGVKMTSLEKIAAEKIDMNKVKQSFITHFLQVWDEVFPEKVMA
mgnify:CR=1 FL=1